LRSGWPSRTLFIDFTFFSTAPHPRQPRLQAYLSPTHNLINSSQHGSSLVFRNSRKPRFRRIQYSTRRLRLSCCMGQASASSAPTPTTASLHVHTAMPPQWSLPKIPAIRSFTLLPCNDRSFHNEAEPADSFFAIQSRGTFHNGLTRCTQLNASQALNLLRKRDLLQVHRGPRRLQCSTWLVFSSLHPSFGILNIFETINLLHKLSLCAIHRCLHHFLPVLDTARFPPLSYQVCFEVVDVVFGELLVWNEREFALAIFT